MLDARIVNSFIDAARAVMENYLTKEIKVGKVTLMKSSYPNEDLNIILGVTGKVRGEIIYGMSVAIAKGIVSRMMGGSSVSKMDEMAISAISELSNMISGNATTFMSQKGLECNLSPPVVIIGEKVELHTLEIKSLCIPLITEVGTLTITVGLEEV